MSFILKNKIITSLLAIVIFTGCGYKESNTQIRDIAYLKFNKSKIANYRVVINDNHEFTLNSCVPDKHTGHCQDDTVNKVYEVSSGNINIKVYDSKNNFLLEKEVYIGSNNTVEVDL